MVEGVGDHGCEYMTAGVVVVLGEAGRNFAAGMTGGVAFVFDEHDNFRTRCNRELVELVRVAEHESQTVRSLIERHYEMTTSLRARQLLSDWERTRNLFWQVVTQAEATRHRDAPLPHIAVPAAFGLVSPVAAAD